jgi:hypothetical protein
MLGSKRNNMPKIIWNGVVEVEVKEQDATRFVEELKPCYWR